MTSDSYSVETVADIRETTLKLIENYEETRRLMTIYTDSMNELFHGTSFLERVQKLDQEFMDVKRKVEKISDLADFMVESAPLLRALPKQTAEFQENFAEHGRKLNILRKHRNELEEKANDLQSQIDEIKKRLDAVEEFNREEPERFAALKEEITSEYKALIRKMKEKITEERQKAEREIAEQAEENLRNAAKEINDRITSVIEGVQEELRKGDADANALIEKLREDLTATVQRQEAADEEIKEAGDAIVELRKDMEEQKSTTQSLRKKHKSNVMAIKAANERIDGLKEEVDANKEASENEDVKLWNALNKLSEDVANQNKRNAADFQSIRTDCEGLHKEDQALSARIDDEVQKLKNKIKEMAETAEAHLEAQVVTLNGSINETNEHLVASDKRFEEYQALMAGVQEKVQGQITEIHEAENGMKEDHAGLSELLNKKEAKLKKQLQAQMEMNQKLAEKVAECAKRNEEVSAQIKFVQGDEDISMTDLKVTLSKAVANLDEAETEMKENLAETRALTLQNIQEAREASEAHISSLKKDLETARGDMTEQIDAKMKTVQDSLEARQTKLNEEFAEAQTKISEFFSGTNLTLPALIDRIKDLDEKYGEKVQTLTQTDSKITADLNAKIESLEAALKVSSTQLEVTRGQFGELEGQVNSRIDEIKGRFAEADEGYQKTIKGFTGKMENKLSEMEGAFGKALNELDRKDSALKDSIDSIPAAIDSKVQEMKLVITSEQDAKLGASNKQIKKLRNIVDVIQGQSGVTIDQLSTEFNKFRDTVNERTKANETGVSNQIQELSTQLQSFENSLNERNVGLREEMSTVKDEMKAQIDEWEIKQKSAISDMMETVTKNMQAVNDRVDEYTGSSKVTIPDIIERIESMKESSESKNGDLDAKIEKLQSAFNQAQIENSSAHEMLLKHIKSRQTELETVSNEMAVQLRENKSLIDEDMAKFQQKLEKFQTQIDRRVADSVTNWNDKADELNRRIERVKKSVKTSETAATENLQKSQNTTQQKIAESANNLQVQIDSLNESIRLLRGSDDMDFPMVLRKIEALENSYNTQIVDIQEKALDKSQELGARLAETEKRLSDRAIDLQQQIDAQKEGERTSREKIEKSQLEELEKIRDSIKTTRAKLEQDIANVAGGATVTLQDVVENMTAFRDRTATFTTKVNDELVALKSGLDKLGGSLKDQLTNEFKTNLAQMRSENSDIDARLQTITEHQKRYATKKEVNAVDLKISNLTGDSKLSIPKVIEQIEEVRTEAASQLAQVNEATSNTLQLHQSELEKISNGFRDMNGGAELSLSQAVMLLRRLEDGLVNCNTLIASNTERFDAELQSLREKNESLSQKHSKNLSDLEHKLEAELAKTNSTVAHNEHNQAERCEAISESIDVLTVAVDNRFKKHKKSTATAFNTLNTTWGDQMTKVATDLSTVTGTFKEFKEQQTASNREIKDSVEALNATVASTSSLFDEKLEAKKNDLTEEIQKSVAAAKKSLSHRFSDSLDHLTDTIEGLKAEFTDFKGDTKITLPGLLNQNSKVLATVTEMESKLDKNSKAIRDELTALIEDVNSKSKKRKQKVKASVSALSDRTANDKIELGEQIRSLQKKLLNEVKASEVRSKDEIANSVQRLTAAVEGLDDKVGQNNAKMSDLVSSATLEMAELKAKVKEAQQRQKSDFDSFLRTAEEAMKKQIVEQNENTSNLCSRLEKDTSRTLEQCRMISEVLSGNLEEVRNIATSAVDQAKAVASEMISEQMKHISAIEAGAENTRIRTGKMITEIKQSFDELKKDESVFQTQQQDALHTMKKQFKQVKQTISDQMAEMSSNVDKELSILKKTTDSIKEESQGVISSLNQSAEQKLNEKTSYLQKMFDDARKQLQGDLESAKSEQSAKDEELRSGIADIDNILKTAYRPQIKAIMKDVAAFRDEVQQQNGKFKSDIGKIRSKADQITNMGSLIEGVQQESEKAIQEFSKRMKTEFLDTKKTVDSVLNKASTDVSELRASIETIMRELMSLKHIHHLNAEFEQFQHRFEEALAFLQQVQRTMCNFVFPGSKELPAVNAKDTIDDKQVSRMKRQKPPTLKGQQVYELDISSLEADDDLGIPIRSALLTHSCVSVTIPPKTQVTWNKSVALLPNQSLIVKGSRGSVIVMDGSSSLGELTDASRVTLDGFCILQVTNVKVQARCFAKSAKAMLDLNALFVARSWDAAGINTIQIDSCEFETDVPVVNIGANAVTHVTITDSRIVSKTKGKTIINPVTAESGGYNHGYGSLTTTNVRITRPNVEWLESPYLSHATSTSNDL